MKLENQVCSLEQAKKLKQLGVAQEGHFMWYEVSDGEDEGDFEKEGVEWHPVLTQSNHAKGEDSAVGSIDSDLLTSDGEFCGHKPPVRAFTVAELGEMFIINDDEHFCDSSYNNHLGVWMALLTARDEEEKSEFKVIYSTEGDTEAECRAEMLIYLLENKIIVPPTGDVK